MTNWQQTVTSKVRELLLSNYCAALNDKVHKGESENHFSRAHFLARRKEMKLRLKGTQ